MRFHIKYKLAAIVLLIFVPLFLFAVFNFYAVFEHEKEDIKTANLSVASTVAVHLDGLIDASFAALRSLSKQPAVINKDSRACDRLFSELLPSYPSHLNILAAGIDGYNYGSGVPSPGVRSLNYNDKEWFVKARKGADVVGNLHISKLFKASAVMIAVPVFDSLKKQVGVLGMPLNLTSVRMMIMKSLPPYEGASITVVDSHGAVLACTNPSQKTDMCKTLPAHTIRAQAEGGNSTEEKGDDGVDRLYSHAGLSRTGWRVIVGVPREIAYQPAYAFGKRYILVLLIVSFTALMLAFLLSKRITKNILSLIAGLQEIERGNLSFSLKLSGHDELQEVAESFDHMAVKRKEAEQKLRDSESFLEAVLDGMGEGVVVVGKDYRIITANKGYCDQVRLPCEAILGKHCYEISHHIDEPCFDKEGGCDCTVKKCFETGQRHRSTHTHFDKDGHPRYLETNAYPLKDPSGAIIAAIETLMDVTALITLEKQLEEVKERYRKLYDDAPDMMHSVDKYGNITICNQTEATALGYELEELIGRPLRDIITPEEREALEMKMSSLRTNGSFEGELTFFAKDSRCIPVFIRSRALYDNDGAFLMSDTIARDITEKKSLEAQLFQAQKMEAVGILAGGVAHDFNNVLTAIVGYGNLLMMRTEPDSTARGYVEQVLAATERATSLTQGLLAFSRKQIISPKPIRLSDVIGQLEKILARVIGEDVELRVFLSPQEATIMADTGQIDQVLMNLATNARDAMQDGGILIIETELIEFDEDYVRRHAFAQPGKYMLISVTDTGQGMDAKTKDKIFEPFFTTKEVGKGTGLGLAMVYGIVKQHNGYLNVYSEPGKGTTFKIYLPVIEREAEKLDVVVLPPVVGGLETILIAEDAIIVRDLAKKVLEEFGYTVILAENGEDAIAHYKADPRVALLILDVIMPGRNGKEVYEEIRKLKPDIKALFMSGYTANIIHKKGILDSGTEFISKPFSPNAFLRKVREVLDGNFC